MRSSSSALKIKNQDQESRRAHRGGRGRWPALDLDVEKFLDQIICENTRIDKAEGLTFHCSSKGV
jgi:hypothetical protein